MSPVLRGRKLRITAFLAGVVVGAIFGPAHAADQPNVVLILADDLGVGDVSAMEASQRSVLQTPHIDDLASGGVLFLEARAPASVCTPTRYSIMTGRHARSTWLRLGVLGPYGSTLIPPRQWTLPRFLKRRGYATSAVGKWHLGIDWHLKDGRIAAPQRRKRDWPQLDLSLASTRGPLDAGFDRFFGVDAPNYPPYAFIRDRHIVGRLTAWRASSNPYETAGLAVPGWRADQVFARLRQEALREIDRLSRGSEPFFLYLPLTGPHHPITPGPDFQGKSGIGPYGDFVLEIDDLVGQIVDRLRRNGELDNTIIIFTSDNGSPAAINDHSLPGSLLGRHRANGDLRGLKAGPYEGGLRVPLVIHWPAGGLAGESVQIVSLIDLAPTIADLIGHPLRSRNPAPAGNSFALDLGADVRPARRWMNGKGEFGVDLNGLETLRWRNWKLVLSATGPELYDLGHDPSEQVNRSGAKPYVVKGLMNRVEWWRVR